MQSGCFHILVDRVLPCLCRVPVIINAFSRGWHIMTYVCIQRINPQGYVWSEFTVAQSNMSSCTVLFLDLQNQYKYV